MKTRVTKIFIICSLLGLCQITNAQDSGAIETKTSQEMPTKEKSIKPLRLGMKIGVPSIITATGEYLTPLLNNRVGFAIDYFALARDFDDTTIDYTNFEIGTHIYANPRGKGFYAGISYTSFASEGTFVEVEFDDSNFSVGDGKADIAYNTFNLKAGLKLGRVFYFRLEVGYGFGDIPQRVVVRSVDDPSLTTVEEIPDIPGLSDSGLLYFNFGFGFGFL